MNEAANRRRFKIILLYLLLLTPWIVSGAIGALKPAANSPLDWVDGDFAPRSDYDAFSERFGAADVVVISWPGCTIENASLNEFTRALRTQKCFFEPEVADQRRWLLEWTSTSFTLQWQTHYLTSAAGRRRQSIAQRSTTSKWTRNRKSMREQRRYQL